MNDRIVLYIQLTCACGFALGGEWIASTLTIFFCVFIYIKAKQIEDLTDQINRYRHYFLQEHKGLENCKVRATREGIEIIKKENHE